MRMLTYEAEVIGYSANGCFTAYIPILDWQKEYLEAQGVECTPIKFADYELVKVSKPVTAKSSSL